MNRLYVVENHFTITGGKADHRLRCPASQIGALAVAIAKKIGATGPLADIVAAFPADAAVALSGSGRMAHPVRRRPRRPSRASRSSSPDRASPPPSICSFRRSTARWTTSATRSSPTPLPTRGPEPTSISGLGRTHRRQEGPDPFHPRRQPGFQRAGQSRLGRQAKERAHGRPSRLPRGRDQRRWPSGTSRRRISSNNGATRAPPTAPTASSSR